jgi:hypothetical protein
VSAAPIVEDLDVTENISAGKISCFVDAFADTFFFQAAEEGFGYCIIPTISASAHTGQQAMPDSERDSPRPLEFYRMTLRAKYHGKHAHSGEIGEALRALGYIRKRGWSSAEGGFRAVWYPPVKEARHD